MSSSSHVYTSVTSYQVLQRDGNNTATIHLPGQAPQTLGVGGPYTVGNAIQVMVGDVWVMAGQSNMRGYGYILDPVSGESLVTRPLARVHLFGSDEKWTLASEPTHRLALSPRRVHHTLPDPTVRDPTKPSVRGASLGLAFAAKYQAEMNGVPVGLIASAHGGVTIQDWTRSAKDPEQDTLYGAMIGRIKSNGYGNVNGIGSDSSSSSSISISIRNSVAGVLWYQGESNAVTHELADGFYDATKNLIKTCKDDLGDQLPFVVVQIGRHLWDDGTNSIQGWGSVRDDQHNLLLSLTNEARATVTVTATAAEVETMAMAMAMVGEGAGMEVDPTIDVVSSIDCEMDDPVHLSAKGLARVGHRLALAASAIILKTRKDGQSASPRLSEARFQSITLPPSLPQSLPPSLVQGTFPSRPSILVSFVPHDLKLDVNLAVNGFSLRDSEGNRVYSIIKALVEGPNVRLYISSQAIKAIESREIYVHYGYGKDPICDLETQSGMGLLASSIRIFCE
ncbi:SGNH hydrolase-type esterase domain-containing protein [Phycomyces blakesleeanus]|uniref:SGNH hydrolase-type esterase domain-containing protein n=1 Tax=Phycomyces blakesleeanus TaxID=4837 RepID=A0ABR3BE29_PHYBL